MGAAWIVQSLRSQVQRIRSGTIFVDLPPVSFVHEDHLETGSQRRLFGELVLHLLLHVHFPIKCTVRNCALRDIVHKTVFTKQESIRVGTILQVQLLSLFDGFLRRTEEDKVLRQFLVLSTPDVRVDDRKDVGTAVAMIRKVQDRAQREVVRI